MILTSVQWASIEIVTACLVANVAFFYALLRELRDGHSNSKAMISTSTARSSVVSFPNVAKSSFSKDIRRTDKMEVEYAERC